MGVKRGAVSLKKAHLLCMKAGARLVVITVPVRYGKHDDFLPLVEGNLILKAIFSFQEFKNQLSHIKVEQNSSDELYIDVTHLIQEKFTSSKIATVSGIPIYVPPQREINFLMQRKHHPNGEYDGTAGTVLEGQKGMISGKYLRSRILQTYQPHNMEANHLDELRLVHGAIMAIAITRHIRIETGYEVSAGVSHSKLLAKIACGFNKPKGITIITDISLKRLSKTIQFQELPGFSRKTGKKIREFFTKRGQTVESVSDVLRLRATTLDLNHWIKIFKQIGISNEDTIAKDLLKKCQFEDESEVTSTMHADKISTTLQFKRIKGCRDSDLFEQFQQLKMNIAQDMASKINYYKEDFGRIATELNVKVKMKKTAGQYVSLSTLVPRHLNSKMTLPPETDQLVSHESIYEFVSEHIANNGFHWDKVSEICLTTNKFLRNKNEGNKKSQAVLSTD